VPKLTEIAEFCRGPCDGTQVHLVFDPDNPQLELCWTWEHGIAVYRRREEISQEAVSAWVRLAADLGAPLITQWDYVGRLT
jgi:hypothetical protein